MPPATQTTTGKQHIDAAQNIIAKLNDVIIFPTITLLMGVAVVVFAWGVFKFVQESKAGGLKSKLGKDLMLYGILGLIIMGSARAILTFATSLFGIPFP